ncbi:hypothetical protein BKA65DRAFT_547061 [Rhexocercosporidium sp. MPI-PUGE-AT-0058]|nr:hypothetical protein BKA65DRAFT_547061 [Rhexocercosporidium sp. MPI-PUGE-AT-0058]
MSSTTEQTIAHSSLSPSDLSREFGALTHPVISRPGVLKEHPIGQYRIDVAVFRAQVAPQSMKSPEISLMTSSKFSVSNPILSVETGVHQFSLFKKLPLELRCLVWRFALPGPRVVRLKFAGNKAHDFLIASELATAKIKVVTSIPGVLYACHDSRTIALKHYHIAFASIPKIQPMFFNFDHDYLHVSLQLLDTLFSGPAMSQVREQILSRIHNLMIGPSCQLNPLSLDRYLMGYFKSLEKIVIPHKFLLGDFRRVRSENACRHHFKNLRRSGGMPLQGIDIEYMTPKEIMEMSRAMKIG